MSVRSSFADLPDDKADETRVLIVGWGKARKLVGLVARTMHIRKRSTTAGPAVCSIILDT
jgi:hypothetical protein